MPRRQKQGFIWIPQDIAFWDVYIDGDLVSGDMITAEFNHGIFGEECPCKIELIDANGTYADKYTGGQEIKLTADRIDGQTDTIWKGTLEHPKKQFSGGEILQCIGSHFQSDLLDITVTEDYSDGVMTGDEILKDLVDKYLTDFTYTNVGTTTVHPKRTWDNKTLYECIVDICNDCEFDAYLDEDKDLHFFDRESIISTTSAVVWNDTMLDIGDLGEDQVDIKNRIIVKGTDNAGMPILYRTNDTASQTAIAAQRGGDGVKEKIIDDTSISTYDEAKEIGDAELSLQKEASTKGTCYALFQHSLNPGESIYITNPYQNIHAAYRCVRFKHTLPDLMTEIVISKDASVPSIFKDRARKEHALAPVKNPYKMEHSINLSFDDASEYDDTLSSDVEVSEGNLKTTGGALGTMVSNRRSTEIPATYVYIKVVGDAMSGTTYEISTDNGENYEAVTLETEHLLATSGSDIRLKVTVNSASTLIDSVVVMYR